MRKKTVGTILCGMLTLLSAVFVHGEEKITIGSVMMNYSGEWFKEALQGQKDAAEDMGVEFMTASSENEISRESDNVAMFLSQDVDALVISPLSAEISAAAVESAVKDAEIPVVTWNSTVDAEVTSHIGTDGQELGGSTGQYAVSYIEEHMADGCRLAVLHNSSYEIAVERCQGFKSALLEFIENGSVEIAVEKEAEFCDEGYEATVEILEEHPDIQMIWCWNQNSLTGCIAAVKEAGRDDIVLLGTDMSLELAEEMLSDEVNLQAITTQMPYDMGYCAVVNAVKKVKGEEVEESILIPTRIYTREKPQELETYIEEHQELAD